MISQKHILKVLFVTLLLDMVGIGMLVPMIPALFTDASSHAFLLTGYSQSAQYFIAGVITALFGLMQFLAAPILGELSDLYGRKKLLTVGVAVLAFSNLVFAAGIALKSLVVLFVSRMLAGVAGANFSIAQAAIADVTEPQNRAKNFGLIGAAFGIGFTLGPLLGGWLAGVTGVPAVPFLFAGVLGILNTVLLITLFPETHPTSTSTQRPTAARAFRNIAQAWADVDVRPVYIVSFLAMLGFTFFTSFIGVFLTERFSFDETRVGTYFAVVGLWVIFVQAVLVRVISSRFTERRILLVALPVLAATIGLQPFVSVEALLYVLIPFHAAAFGLITTSIPALVSKGISATKQGAGLGINASVQALTSAIAPLSAGILSAYIGISFPFYFGSIALIIALVVLKTSRVR
jgi:MFS transporter, DHA1 family, tetracycline resistance protein